MDPHSHVDGSASIKCRVGDVGLRRPHRVLSCVGDFLGKVELESSRAVAGWGVGQHKGS